MKNKILETVEIPQGISCEYKDNILTCKKGSVELSRKISIPGVKVEVKGNTITLNCNSANKNQYKIIKSYIAHLNNMFRGIDEKFTYILQACNVHFPMTLKVDNKKLIISNFLGEKTPRYAKILPDVDVEIKGQNITVSSYDKEAAGHTAANMEKATKIKNRDRRVFQDGIFLVSKPRRTK